MSVVMDGMDATPRVTIEAKRIFVGCIASVLYT